MRIHHLEVTAFGPFPGSESVDFDALTDAGLFLLCGPTGAGKTSVLDALCFGLYGEVPGDRNTAKRLRSDHAAPGVAPSVLLEVTLNGRRFRIGRSPAWQRPKRRGTGTTTEQARVNLEEYAEGGWRHLSNRLDETGHLVTDLLGMNVGQFTQVAMLPQGRFQSFLRARSDERHKVLQQLFRTSRFEDVEKWLVGHRQSLKAANRGHQEAVASVVSRLSEVSEQDLPHDWDLHDLTLPAEKGHVADWATSLVLAAAAATELATADLQETTGRVAAARLELLRAREQGELRRRHLEALGIDSSLSSSRPEADAARARLDAARRAAPVAPLVRVADDAERAAAAAQRGLPDALAEAASFLGPEAPTPDGLVLAEREAREAAGIAKALLPREAELKQAQRRFETTVRHLGELATESTRVDQRCVAIPAELAALRTRLAEQVALAASEGSAEKALLLAVERLEAASKVTVIGDQVASARELLHARTDVAQSLRETMHDVREARIGGMAAELAAALAGGGCCPVCGSADHPSVATPVPGAPTQAHEERARAAFEDADFTRQAQAEAVATLERNKALAEQSAGGRSAEDLGAEVQELRDRLSDCRGAGLARQHLTGQLSCLEEEQDTLQRRAQELRADVARAAQERDHAQETIEKVSTELSALFDDGEVAGSVARLIEARTSAGSAFARAREALVARDAAGARSAEAQRHAVGCAREHGFDTVAAASAATLTRGEVEALEEVLRARDELRAKADTVLADPEVLAATREAPLDVTRVEQANLAAEGGLADCGARSRVADDRARRLERLGPELTAELDAWAPTRSAHAVAQAVSTFADGKGADNTLQIRLSAYVLASRLQQVVAAANERLRTMSDERYTLEHSAARGVGELRGGLSLQVRDEWTGDSRDPATLSGGETFVASLALALGLADVVTQEAGGSSIDTLFIDEGFGSLDPETLDDVMNTLDRLRDGGRVVGIVSHVPEMRTRVTAQLQIRKDRAGSHVMATREAM